MEKPKRQWISFAINLILFIFLTFDLVNGSYFFHGWKKLDLPDSHVDSLYISPSSGRLLIADSPADTFYFYPEGFSDVSIPKTYTFEDILYLYPMLCFINNDQDVLTYIGVEEKMISLESGEVEQLPEIINSQYIGQCAYLNDGSRLITTTGGLIFNDYEDWYKVEIPWLKSRTFAAEGEDGTIWLLESDGDLFSFERNTQHITYTMNIWAQKSVQDLLVSKNIIDIPLIISFNSIPGDGFLVNTLQEQLGFKLLIDKSDTEVEALPEFKSDPSCDVFYADPGGDYFFIANQKTIFQYNRNNTSYELKRTFEVPDYIECMTGDPIHNILVVLTWDGVFYRKIKD